MKLNVAFFLIFHCIITVSCQKRSLIFIFDTSGSMEVNLENFKKGTDLIVNKMSKLKNSPIYNYILVPFNDPEYGPPKVTKNENEFRRILNDIKVAGGGDCPEMAFSALKQGLEQGLPYSYVYVMTDATEKDSHLLEDIKDLVQSKKIRVTFLLTKGCKGRNIKNYQTIASASSGLVFNLTRSNEIVNVLKYIEDTLNENTIDISFSVNPPGKKNETITVDESIKGVQVIVSGGKPFIEVLDQNKKVVKDPNVVKPTINLPHVQGIQILKPSIGQWTLNYGSDEKYTVQITGISEIKFKLGFTTSDAINMLDSSSRPLANEDNKLLVSVDEGYDKLRNVYKAELVTTSGKILSTLELEEITYSDDPFIFRTGEFTPPNGLFHIITYAKDKKGNIIKRISATAYQARKIEKKEVPIKEVSVKIDGDLTLFCKVDGSGPIVVKWSKNNKKLQENDFEQGGEAVYVKRNVKKNDEGEYRCDAISKEGTQTTNILVKVTN